MESDTIVIDGEGVDSMDREAVEPCECGWAPTSLSDMLRQHIVKSGLTYSIEVEPVVMREIPLDDVVYAVLNAVDEWLSGGEPITLEGESEDDLTVHHLNW